MKFWRLTLLAIGLVSLFSFQYQKGKQFPTMVCENLDDQEITLPTDTKGKYTLLSIAYSKKAEDDLKSWITPIYLKFIAKPDKPTLFWEPYDINLYLVPMFTGVNAVAAGQAKKEIKKKVDPKLYEHMLVFKGKIKQYKEVLQMKEKNHPYFFVLDESGEIVHVTSGAYSEAKLTAIEEKLQGE